MKYNFDLLDKKKEYALYFVPSKVKIFSAHWFIQLKAKQTIKKYKLEGIKDDIATHSAMLIWLENDWWIYESHIKAGVTKYPASLIQTESYICAYQEDLIIERMNAMIGRSYGKLDMLGFANEYLGVKNSNWHKLDCGEFCTEYFLKCLTEDGFLNYMLFYDSTINSKLKAYQYEPVMQQYYAIKSGKEIIKL